MRIFSTILLSLLSSTLLFAQKIEVSIQTNSGLFHYSGPSATSTSSIIKNASTAQNFTDDPYGDKNGFSYGGNIQIQYVNKKGFIIGLQTGYEILRSKVDINVYYPNTSSMYPIIPGPLTPVPVKIPVTGQTYLQNNDININPYIGYRLQLKKIKIDVMPGLDFGFNTNSYYKGSATDNSGNVYQTNMTFPHAHTDLGLRFGVAANYKKFGITANYAHGLTNLAKDVYGTSNSIVHSELLGFGITYRIL